jgi:hypothetical protein
MATQTPNIGLTKQAQNEYNHNPVLNSNWDIVDSKMGHIPSGKSVQEEIGDLSDLTTTDKSSLVGAANELNSKKTNFQTEWFSLAKNGGSATWNVGINTVSVGILIIVGQWNTAWRYMGMVYRNDAGSGLFDIITSGTLSVSMSGNTITITNNNAENAQNVRATFIG